ncbi:MAG: glycosyltransferase family 39 protein, partial [Patescibacteria group bacterium]
MINLVKRLLNYKYSEYLILFVVLVLGFSLRLYKIESPIADWHSWRQADTASVTRNFVDQGINLLYPTYHDISSIQTGSYNPRGYRFVEFPLYNFIHAILTKSIPFLTLEVWGRLLSAIFACSSALFIFLIAKDLIDKKTGILAAFFFLFIPYNIYFSRVILPEPLAICLGLAAIWIFILFIKTEKYAYLYLSALVFALSMLVKPFTFFYSVALIYLLWKKYGFGKLLDNGKLLIRLSIAMSIALLPFFVWRIWVNQHPTGIPHFNWAFNGDKIRFRPAFWRWIFGERLGYLILGIWGIVPFAYGILKKSKNLFPQFFFLGGILYVITFATANVRHDYYQTFLIPAISLILAQGSIYFWESKEFNSLLARPLLIFSILMMFGVGAYQVKEYYRINHPEIIEAGKAVDQIAQRDDLVVASYNGDTAF